MLTPLSVAAQHEWVRVAVHRLLAATARAFNSDVVITADNTSTVAADVIRHLCQARGASVLHELPASLPMRVPSFAPHIWGKSSEEKTHVRFVRPLRDLINKALALYSTFSGATFHAPVTALRSKSDLMSLSRSFIATVHAQNESSSYNILRTAEKLRANPNAPASIAQYLIDDDNDDDEPTCGQKQQTNKKVTHVDTPVPVVETTTAHQYNACSWCLHPVVPVPEASAAQMELLDSLPGQKKLEGKPADLCDWCWSTYDCEGSLKDIYLGLHPQLE
jgi:hypothetical protein